MIALYSIKDDSGHYFLYKQKDNIINLISDYDAGDPDYEKIIVNAKNNNETLFFIDDYKKCFSALGPEYANKHFSREMYIQKKVDKFVKYGLICLTGILFFYILKRK